MTENRRTTRKKRPTTGRLLIILLLVTVAALCLFLFFSTPKQQERSISAIKERVERTVASVETSLKEIGDNLPADEKKPEERQEALSADEPAETASQPGQPVSDNQQQNPETVVNTFFDHLDDAEYIKEFSLHSSSREHFSRLTQKLLDNPPVVVSETDDLFTLLKNTAHFFRVLGRHSTFLVKIRSSWRRPSP